VQLDIVLVIAVEFVLGGDSYLGPLLILPLIALLTHIVYRTRSGRRRFPPNGSSRHGIASWTRMLPASIGNAVKPRPNAHIVGGRS
jgi:hypothetical protein